MIASLHCQLVMLYGGCLVVITRHPAILLAVPPSTLLFLVLQHDCTYALFPMTRPPPPLAPSCTYCVAFAAGYGYNPNPAQPKTGLVILPL